MRKKYAMIRLFIFFRIFVEQDVKANTSFTVYRMVSSFASNGLILYASLRNSGGDELDKQDNDNESHVRLVS